MGLDEKGMGWHSFRRFRKTWSCGRRGLEDLNNFWIGHKPETMSEQYSHLYEEMDIRIGEAEAASNGSDLPRTVVAPNAPKKCSEIGGLNCSASCREDRDKIGGRDRDRTGDPLLAKQVLSQLSYTPTVGYSQIIFHHLRRNRNRLWPRNLGAT
jgi:hypothetical protein